MGFLLGLLTLLFEEKPTLFDQVLPLGPFGVQESMQLPRHQPARQQVLSRRSRGHGVILHIAWWVHKLPATDSVREADPVSGQTIAHARRVTLQIRIFEVRLHQRNCTLQCRHHVSEELERSGQYAREA